MKVWFTYNFPDANSCWHGSEHDNHIILMDGAHKQKKRVTWRVIILTIHSNKASSTFRTPILLFRPFWFLLHGQRIEEVCNFRYLSLFLTTLGLVDNTLNCTMVNLNSRRTTWWCEKHGGGDETWADTKVYELQITRQVPHRFLRELLNEQGIRTFSYFSSTSAFT
jgi:hypothetical protein